MQAVLPGFEPPAYALRPERRSKKHRQPRAADARSHAGIVYEALEEHGDMNCAEIAAMCSLTAKQVCRRMRDLERAGIAHRALDQDEQPLLRAGLSERLAQVWSVA